MLNLIQLKEMKKSLLTSLFILILMMNSIIVFAQDATLEAVVTTDGAIMISVSDNGQWSAGYYSDGTQHFNASIWDLTTYERINLVSAGQLSAAYDVTDDGTMVVGSYNDKPGYWQDGSWTELPTPIENGIGSVFSVTPDGSKMVGRVLAANYSSAHAGMWENGELVEVNHDMVDRSGYNAYFNEMNDISADGNTMLGCLNYTVLPDRTAFLMKDGEYFMFGAEYYEPATGGNEYNFYDLPNMSPDGKWVTGDIYWVEPDFSDEYWCPFRYDVENDITELFLDDIEVASFAADNNGNLYGATPLNYPIRDAVILKDGSWISYDQEILNEYGLNVYEETGYDKLSNIWSVSADGKTVIGCNGLTTYNWVFKLPQTVNVEENSLPANEMKAVMKGSSLVLQGKVSHVNVCSATGKVVLDQSVNSFPIFNLSHLSSGIYVVVMKDYNQQVKTTKIWVGKR